MSTKPGVTRAPSASTTRSADPVRRPTSTTTPSLTPTSALRLGAPVPSMTVPPLITRSSSAMCSSCGQRLGVDAVQVGHVLAQDGPTLLLGQGGGVLGQQLLRPRPGGVRVGEVVGPHEPAPVHGPGEAEGGPVVLERHVDAVGEVLAGQTGQR